MREKLIEEKCRKYAKGLGWSMPKWTSPGENGVHDRLLLVEAKTQADPPKVLAPGMIVPIEFKGTGCRLTQIQKQFHRRMDALLIEHHTIDNFEDFVALCDDLKNR